MKLKKILVEGTVALGLLAYSSIGNSYAHDMNNAHTLAASSKAVYSGRPVLTKNEREERKRSLEYLRDVFVEEGKEDSRPSANIEELAVELIGNPLIRKPTYGGFRYGYGLMTPAESYVILPRHAFIPIELYIRMALEGDRFPIDELSKGITVYNLDKSHEDTFNFLRDNLNVRDNNGNLYPLNPYMYCSVPSLDIVVTKAEPSKNSSPLKISFKKAEVGDRLNLFNIGGRSDNYLSQETITVMTHSKPSRMMYSEEYSQIIFNTFLTDTIGRRGVSGSTLSDNNELSGMVIGIAIPSNKSQNNASPFIKYLQNHKVVATSARNIVKAVKWCANKGLKELDSITIVD